MKYLSAPKSGFSFTFVDDICAFEDAPVMKREVMNWQIVKLLQSLTSIMEKLYISDHVRKAGLIRRMTAMDNVQDAQQPST